MKKLWKEVAGFYPEYLRAHDNLANRVLHFAGATLFFCGIAAAFLLQEYWLLPVAVFTGYALPGIGHHSFQRNKSFRGSRPVLCVICAFRMYIDTLLFQTGKKLRRLPQQVNFSGS